MAMKGVIGASIGGALALSAWLCTALRPAQAAGVDAFEWLKSRADTNNATACLYLGHAYLKRADRKMPTKRMPYWVRKTDREYWGHSNAVTGREDFAGSLCEGVALYKRAVELGNTQAMSSLGRAYASGQCLKKDCDTATRLFQRAADLGDADGWNNLGVQHATGCGITVDRAMAETLYRKAAELRSAAGMYNLAGCYRKRDENVEARRWLRMAADLGHGEAAYNFAFMCERGLGGAVDAGLVFQYYTIARELGVE